MYPHTFPRKQSQLTKSHKAFSIFPFCQQLRWTKCPRRPGNRVHWTQFGLKKIESKGLDLVYEKWVFGTWFPLSPSKHRSHSKTHHSQCLSLNRIPSHSLLVSFPLTLTHRKNISYPFYWYAWDSLFLDSTDILGTSIWSKLLNIST